MEEHRQSTDRNAGLIPSEVSIPDGYLAIRVLSERNGSWVYLARNQNAEHCCLKIQKLAVPASLDEILETRSALVRISESSGFVRIRKWGHCKKTLAVWEELDLADDLVSGKAFDPSNEQTYTPLTLAAYVRENGSVPTIQIIEWGIQISRALVKLHESGMFHRDIKPVNILIQRGQCVIADYGSVGKAGSSIEFPGTEGYVPPDGMGSAALDVFALGRSLYEAWTGLDRFQFPSLPKGLVDSPNWKTHGWQLNKILSEAADKRVSHRIPTAKILLEKLEIALKPKRTISRRKLIAGFAYAAIGTGGFYIWKSLPPYKAVWKRLPPERFGYEQFHASELTCDWKNKILYSIHSDTRASVVQAYDLKTFTHREYSFPTTKQPLNFGVYLNEVDELWSAEHVSGKISRFISSSKSVLRYERPDLEFSGFTGRPYFNPITNRVGHFAGYGNFRCHSQRHEFNASSQEWILIKEDSQSIPSPRCFDSQTSFVARRNAGNPSLIVYGGIGNATGKQYDRMPALKWYDGKFYPLNDLWELDFRSNQWRQLLGLQSFNPTALKSIVCHDSTDSILFLTGSEPGNPREAKFYRTSGRTGEIPIPIPNLGERIELFRCWCLIQNPETQDLWVFADEGVYSVTLKAA